MTTKSFKIITLGCKVNQYESVHIREALLGEGYREVDKNKKADIVLVNTCIVTQRASYQSRQALRRAIKDNPSAMTGAVGCYAQVFPEELSAIDGLGIIAGNTSKGAIAEILRENGHRDSLFCASEDFSQDTPFEMLPVKGFSEKTRAFLKIQDGCDAFCSYCIVPYARGPLRSLDAGQVVSSLRTLSEEGYKEVVLSGIHLGKYGVDLDGDTDLIHLLSRIGVERLPLRIRLSSIEPNEIEEDLVAMMAEGDWLCRHFHIPLQSGDDLVLEKMNRHYSARDFGKLVELIHKRMPLAAIGVDTMAGFPGEDDRAFQNTYNLVRDLPVSYLHVFPFSPRKGTPAERFKEKIHEKTIKERATKLRDLGQQKRESFYRSCIGKEFKVLVQGWCQKEKMTMEGITDNYLPATFVSGSNLRNQIVPLGIEKANSTGVFGTIKARKGLA